LNESEQFLIDNTCAIFVGATVPTYAETGKYNTTLYSLH